MHERVLSVSEYRPSRSRKALAGFFVTALTLTGCGSTGSVKRDENSAGNDSGEVVGKLGYALVSKDTIGSIDGANISAYVYADPDGVQLLCTLAVSSEYNEAGVSNSCNYDAYNDARAKFEAEQAGKK
jgi:hypothetical protein